MLLLKSKMSKVCFLSLRKFTIKYTNKSFISLGWEKVNLKLEKILPESSTLNKYYRYSGSLTTPPCTEGIKWNVFATYINISREQVSVQFY